MNKKFFLKTLAVSFVASLAIGTGLVQAEEEGKIKVGIMLSFTGPFADLAKQTLNGFTQYVEEQGGYLGGKKVEYVIVDDEGDPSKSVENSSKLVKKDKVDVIVGSIHSGVLMGLTKVARDTGTPMIIPNAGTNEVAGPLCAKNLFRVSFSNWQHGFATGKYVGSLKKEKVVALTMDYTAGKQYVAGFKEAFEKSGGKVIKEMYIPLDQLEFQAYLSETARLKPDAIYAFFGGAAASKFIKDYVDSGLKATTPVYGPGPLTDYIEEMKGMADGIETTTPWAIDLDNEKNKSFVANYINKYKTEPKIYAVYGYDSAQLLAIGLAAANGDVTQKEKMYQAMETSYIDSPRGKFKLSKGHDPIQNFYIQRVENNKNKVVGIAVEKLENPDWGCKM